MGAAPRCRKLLCKPKERASVAMSLVFRDYSHGPDCHDSRIWPQINAHCAYWCASQLQEDWDIARSMIVRMVLTVSVSVRLEQDCPPNPVVGLPLLRRGYLAQIGLWAAHISLLSTILSYPNPLPEEVRAQPLVS